jgi:hypothetical protein
MPLLRLIPSAVVGSLLCFSGVELLLAARPQRYRRTDLAQIVTMECCVCSGTQRSQLPSALACQPHAGSSNAEASHAASLMNIRSRDRSEAVVPVESRS